MNRTDAKATWFGSRKLKVSFGPGTVLIDMGRMEMTSELRNELNELLCRFMNGVDHSGPSKLKITIQSNKHSETISYNSVVGYTDNIVALADRLEIDPGDDYEAMRYVGYPFQIRP